MDTNTLKLDPSTQLQKLELHQYYKSTHKRLAP